MNCPTCGGPTRVVSTDKFDRFVVRIRKCTQCGASETTDEIPRIAAKLEPMVSSNRNWQHS